MSNKRLTKKATVVPCVEILDEKAQGQLAPPSSLDKPQSDLTPTEDLLMASQLYRSTPHSTLPIENANQVLRENVLDLYRMLAPRNAQESILVRHLVAVNNAGLECYAKLAESNNLLAQEMYIKYALKSSSLAIDLVESLAKLRGEIGPDVSVGNVNVEAGGQAIVGKVAVGDQPKGCDENTAKQRLKRVG